jgi:hypothetical protein
MKSLQNKKKQDTIKIKTAQKRRYKQHPDDQTGTHFKPKRAVENHH